MSDASLGALAEEVGDLLRRRGETLALAESCTGGMIAAAITEVAGSSDYLWGSAVVYTTHAKEVLAGLDPDRIREQGAVSAPTTEALAEAVRLRARAAYGLAVTGWAGPSADPPDELGVVFIALVDTSGVVSWRDTFEGDRNAVRRQASAAALIRLRARLSVAQEVDDGDDET